jgi:hypothetical protein
MKNWDDERILEYLMTSEFEDNLSPEDLKFLLWKFRYFYRVISTRSNNIEMEKKRFDFEIETLKLSKNKEIEDQKKSYHHLLNIYNSITSRKLSLIERITGKIKLGPNENI